jgi:FAD/FMN-containing dehydrogenase
MAAKADPLQPVDVLRGKLRGRLYTPADSFYNLARRGLGTTPVDDRFPALVVLPEGPDDIARTLDFARAQHLEISVRSGGHDVFGASTTATGVVIDLSRMNAVSFDPATGIARAGAGARSGELIVVGAAHGRAPVLGMHPHIGLGGVTLGGGIGWLCGAYGAAVDHLFAVDVVTADGRMVRANAQENADLFWALRGGGGNFGVVTAFTYQMQPVTQVLAGAVSYKADPSKFLRFLREFLAGSPDALDIGTAISMESSPTASTMVCWSGDPAEGEKVLRPLRTFAPAMVDTIKLQNYVNFANNFPDNGLDKLFWRGGEVDGLNDSVIDAIAGIIDRKELKNCSIGVLHYMHGALCRAPAGSTPFIREQGHILYNMAAFWGGEVHPQEKMEWVRATAETLKAVNSKQTYLNYLSYEGEQPVRNTFGPHYARLQEVKRKYDPDNVFHNNRNIRA